MFACVIFQAACFDGFNGEAEISGIGLEPDHRVPDISENFIGGGTFGLCEQAVQLFFDGFAFGGPDFDFSGDVNHHFVRRGFNDLTEFIGADELLFTGAVRRIFKAEDESAAVGITPAAGVPVFIGNGPEAGVFALEGYQRGVNGLFFRADETDLHFAFLQGKHLRPEHGGIRDTD